MAIELPILFNKRHILPAGRLPLRVHVGEQMKTVQYAMRHGLDLGVCMNDTSPTSLGIGTRVTIEDFNISKHDSVLTITVKGHECFTIERIEKTKDDVVLAQCQFMPIWPECTVTYEAAPLAERLQIMYERYPELGSMHAEQHFEDLSWLCQRWLELLPLPSSEKQTLMSAHSCADTAAYLISLMRDPH